MDIEGIYYKSNGLNMRAEVLGKDRIVYLSKMFNLKNCECSVIKIINMKELVN